MTRFLRRPGRGRFDWRGGTVGRAYCSVSVLQVECQDLHPGTHHQVLRVVDELVDNPAKYTAVGGLARVAMDVDDGVFDCMVTNAVDAAQNSDDALSSGLGLADARRRV
ncbi:hypothetical protein [Actinomyces ruminicola]|uniref:hypothetical protein n=1 Tax=Actinomyces ruminicola TaxID=332524 RepID=UPI000B865D31|nr:hypothetical protein [Actinomyces ruminicola]